MATEPVASAANAIDIAIFANRCAPAGSGCARLSLSSPWSRSMASPTPNAMKPEIKYVAICGFAAMSAESLAITTPNRRYKAAGMTRNGNANAGARSVCTSS